jgi:Thioredoxin reductase
MTDVIVIGGGPAGLSAALFTAKNGLSTKVFDTGETWMHKAHLFNYLGVGSVDGTAFMQTARQQVRDFGAEVSDVAVDEVSESEAGFTVSTDEEAARATYIVLATGADRSIAEALGCATTDEEVVEVSLSMETSIEGVYATGAMVRAQEWQAVIAAGDGATAALDILSKEEGDHFHDFDVPATAGELFETLAAE